MFDAASQKLQELHDKLEKAKAISSILQSVQNSENFAVVVKDGKTYFVAMNPEQARVVNGESIEITGDSSLTKMVKDKIVEQMNRVIQSHASELSVLDKALTTVGSAVGAIAGAVKIG